MKTLIAAFAFVSIGLPAFAAEPIYQGTCLVFIPGITSPEPTILAQKDVSLAAGQTVTLYKQGRIEYQVTLWDLEDTKPLIHSLDVVATYGSPDFLGEAGVDFTDAAIAAKAIPTIRLVMPNYPVISCQSK